MSPAPAPAPLRAAAPRRRPLAASSRSARGQASLLVVAGLAGMVIAAVIVGVVARAVGREAGVAEGGGYDGRLAYRQGKPMRPDVALAFDRLDAAARADGVDLVITSGYRSDAEQAALFARHPDPKWVARPGTSLHRYATEL